MDSQTKKQRAEDAFKSEPVSDWKNKQRTLVLSSRGVTQRHRHLMLDIFNFMPHAKKEVKLEKQNLSEQLNELANMHSCSHVLYFETRKKQDLYLWLGKAPTGPSIKFLVENIHTSDELKLTGNCLKYSRPILSFSEDFEVSPHWQLIKQLLVQTFNTPKNHPKSQPFLDHVLSFNIADNRIWFRNYQINTEVDGKEKKTELFEIGPRFLLNPIVILDGNLSGEVLYQNPEYESRVEVGRKRKRELALKFKDKVTKKSKKEHYLHKFDIEQDDVNEFFEEGDQDDEDKN